MSHINTDQSTTYTENGRENARELALDHAVVEKGMRSLNKAMCVSGIYIQTSIRSYVKKSPGSETSVSESHHSLTVSCRR